MAYTLSWHKEGQAYVKQGHSRRDKNAVSKQDHINHDLSKYNVYLVDIPIREAYKELFGDSVKEYNARARDGRQIDDYYKKIYNDEKQQTAYEVVVQIGSLEEGVPDQAISALTMYACDWGRRNPNMKMIGAYIHADEGSLHLHIDFIPFAESKRGMRVQNSLTKALSAQGFCHSEKFNKHKTPLIRWEQSERDSMREICANMGIDLKAQGKGRKKHFSVKEYKEFKEGIKALEEDYANKLEYSKKINTHLTNLFEDKEYVYKAVSGMECLCRDDPEWQAFFDQFEMSMEHPDDKEWEEIQQQQEEDLIL